MPFESLAEGLIEGANGCLQVDFANEYIGGGVLGMGNVQVYTCCTETELLSVVDGSSLYRSTNYPDTRIQATLT